MRTKLIVLLPLLSPMLGFAAANTDFVAACASTLAPTTIKVLAGAVPPVKKVVKQGGADVSAGQSIDGLSHIEGNLQILVASQPNYQVNPTTNLFCSRPLLTLSFAPGTPVVSFSGVDVSDKKNCVTKAVVKREALTLKRRAQALELARSAVEKAMIAHYGQQVYSGPISDLAYHSQAAFEKNWVPFAQEVYAQALFDLDWSRMTDAEIALLCEDSATSDEAKKMPAASDAVAPSATPDKADGKPEAKSTPRKAKRPAKSEVAPEEPALSADEADLLSETSPPAAKH